MQLSALAKTSRLPVVLRLESGMEITSDELPLSASRALRLPERENNGQINRVLSDKRSKKGVDIH